jgi:hypothetical protein
MARTKKSTRTRAERAAAMCRHVTAEIGEIAPAGMTKRRDLWRMVAGPTDVFLDALLDWEKERATVDDVDEAHTQMMDAWREAAQRFATTTPCIGAHP